MKFLNPLLTRARYKRMWNKRYCCESSCVFQRKCLDIYNWIILWHSGQFFSISTTRKLPYTGIMKSVYARIWTYTDIYRPNTDIRVTSVFALSDKRKYEPWVKKCRYTRLSFLWARTRFTNAASFRIILTIPSMTFIDRGITIWSITNSFVAFSTAIIGIWVT